MNNDIKYAVFDKTESIKESIFKDLITLAVVTLLVYVSQGSSFWTLITGLMFIIVLGSQISFYINSRYKIFKTKRELKEWVESLPEDNIPSKPIPPENDKNN